MSCGDDAMLDDIADDDAMLDDIADKDFVPGEYFVSYVRAEVSEISDFDNEILRKFDDLGVKVRYHYKSTGAYCVVIETPCIFRELSSLEYLTIEPVNRFKALAQEG